VPSVETLSMRFADWHSVIPLNANWMVADITDSKFVIDPSLVRQVDTMHIVPARTATRWGNGPAGSFKS